MSLITGLEVQKNNKHRLNIFVDGEYKFSLNEEIVLKHKLKPGIEIDTEFIKNLSWQDDLKESFNKALNYLSYMSRTKEEVRNYLIKVGYDNDIIELTLEKLFNYEFLNDEKYSDNFISINKTKKFSKRELQYKLQKKGIDKELIEEAISNNYSDEEEIISAKKLIEKYHKKYKDFEFEKMQYKIKGSLYSKGYSVDTINKAVEEYFEEIDWESRLDSIFLLTECKVYNIINL